MASVQGNRQHARFEVRWPLLYASDELIGHGTMLNVSRLGCQIAGTMPVSVGMQLKIWVTPPHREETVYVEEARVLWVKGHEFGVELCRLGPFHQRWLQGFLETAERRASFRKMAPGPDMAATPLALPIKD